MGTEAPVYIVSSAWIKLAVSSYTSPLGSVVMWYGEGRPPGYTEENSLPADGRIVCLADWPEWAALVLNGTFEYGGDDRSWWGRLRRRPRRSAALPDLRGRVVVAR